MLVLNGTLKVVLFVLQVAKTLHILRSSSKNLKLHTNEPIRQDYQLSHYRKSINIWTISHEHANHIWQVRLHNA